MKIHTLFVNKIDKSKAILEALLVNQDPKILFLRPKKWGRKQLCLGTRDLRDIFRKLGGIFSIQEAFSSLRGHLQNNSQPFLIQGRSSLLFTFDDTYSLPYAPSKN